MHVCLLSVCFLSCLITLFPSGSHKLFSQDLVLCCQLQLSLCTTSASLSKRFHFFCSLSLPQLLSLTLDGLTGVAQDHMRARYQTGANHMMLNVNLWSILVLGLGEKN